MREDVYFANICKEILFFKLFCCFFINVLKINHTENKTFISDVFELFWLRLGNLKLK